MCVLQPLSLNTGWEGRRTGRTSSHGSKNYISLSQQRKESGVEEIPFSRFSCLSFHFLLRFFVILSVYLSLVLFFVGTILPRLLLILMGVDSHSSVRFLLETSFCPSLISVFLSSLVSWFISFCLFKHPFLLLLNRYYTNKLVSSFTLSSRHYPCASLSLYFSCGFMSVFFIQNLLTLSGFF